MAFDVPPFLTTGALNWTEYGFHYPSPPPIDLLSAAALNSENPWIVLAAVIERAKTGDHTHVRTLQRWFDADPPLSRMCIVAIGAIGTDADLRMLVPLMEQGPNDARVHACIGAERAGNLWLVPHMLQAWHYVSSIGDHETIGYALSGLLEEPNGPIAAKAGDATLRLEDMSPERARLLAMTDRHGSDRFGELVKMRLADVTKRSGRPDAPVWNGKIFHVVGFATEMLRQVKSPEGATAPITLREKFEAATGINCSSFFRNGRFQPLAAAAVLEEFLESPQVSRYEEGARYFFEHQIPSD
jgi:hypothetical protein